MSRPYDRDHYAWTMEQAELLRRVRLGDADIAEKIESLGRSGKRELVSRLQVLPVHLLPSGCPCTFGQIMDPTFWPET